MLVKVASSDFDHTQRVPRGVGERAAVVRAEVGLGLVVIGVGVVEGRVPDRREQVEAVQHPRRPV